MKIHLALLLSTSLAIGAGESFYKAPALFSTRPDESGSLNTIPLIPAKIVHSVM